METHPQPMPQSHLRRIRVRASDTRFFAAFAGSYQTFRETPPLTDDAIYAAFHRVYCDPTSSPRWQAGRIAGWFAALYHIPCTFAEAPALPSRPSHAPRAIDLQVTEPLFVAAYREGYQRAAAWSQEHPLTDDDLFLVLDGAYFAYVYGRHGLTATRCCAGYLAGWFAHFYGIQSLVADSLVLSTSPGQREHGEEVEA
jgi:hypothetical protein